MKRILSLSLLVMPFILQAQNKDSLWFARNYSKKEVYIPMRDGVRLFTSIYYPKSKTEKHPVLMTRTPYSSAPYGAKKYTGEYWGSYKNAYVKEGYILIKQDVRGRWMSEGDFVNVRPFNADKTGTETDEASDTYDTIDWLVKNLANNNGKVGVFGISYPGFLFYYGCRQQPPGTESG